MKKITAAVFLVLGAIVLGGCSLYGSPSASNSMPGNMPNTPSASSTPVSTNMINIQNFAFSPQTITVAKGATVTWTNNDSASHQIKSQTFNSNLLGKGQTFSFTFNDSGTFDYSCAIHPSMTGKIVVQ
jgi:plastocyanin